MKRFSPFFFVVSKIIPKFAASHVLANASDLTRSSEPSVGQAGDLIL